MKIVEGIEVEAREEEILRLLRRGGSSAKPGNWTLGVVREAVKASRGLCEPRGVYEFVDRASLPDHPVFRSAQRVGMCVCTIGPELESRVAELMEEGQLARGVVLDAVGSEMAEATARSLDARMGDEGAREGLLASGRFSPGYGSWELEGQRLIFDVLDAALVGVELTPSMMMIPRKSVSFAINLGPDPEPPRCDTPCDQCELEHCPYRRE